METSIMGMTLKDGKILLIKDRDFWTLPGGRLIGEESDKDCLYRNIIEKIPSSTGIKNLFHHSTIEKILENETPSLINIYFFDIIGDNKIYEEKEDSKFVHNPLRYNLSDITRKIIESYFFCTE